MEKKNSLIQHFTQSLQAAWELIKLNPKAMDYFDISADSFWKSFWAIALTAPMLLLWLLNINNQDTQEPNITAINMANLIGMILHLPLFAMVMILFTKFLKIDAYYSSMIIAYNWLFVLICYSIIPLQILVNNGMLSAEVGSIILFSIVFYLQLYVVWFTFKNSLRISGYLAIGVLVFELMFSASVMIVLFRFFSLFYSSP